MDEPYALHIRTRHCGYNLGHLASRPDFKVRNPLGLLPEDQLEQRPRCTDQRLPKVPLRQPSDHGMLETNIPGDVDGNAACLEQGVRVSGKDLVQGLQAACEKAMGMPALRDPKSCFRSRLQNVALQHQDLPEIGC